MPSLWDRFTGQDRDRLLREALRLQRVALGSPQVVEALASAAELRRFQASEELITQGDGSNDLFLLLAGSVDVVVNRRTMARRQAGQHVGEMAVISVSAPRAATVIAREETIAAVIAEPAFTRIANDHPETWRQLAAELADRLRQRPVPDRRERPVLFIGSSREGLSVARELQNGLAHDPVDVQPWTIDVFGKSKTAIESLEEAARNGADFAALVLTPDDLVEHRGNTSFAPRDNVLFELGLFIGALGRSRVFIVQPRGVEMRLPSDLLGIVAETYQTGTDVRLALALGHVCNRIRHAVAELGGR